MWDPQQYLIERHPNVRVVEWELPPPLMGCCDHRTGTIWLAAGLTPVQRRSTLAYEVAELEQGPRSDDPCLAWAKRKAAEEWAALMLIPSDVFAASWALHLDLAAMAAFCEVDVPTFRARIRAASDADQDAAIEGIAATRLSA